MNILYISELSNLGGGETSLLNLINEFNKDIYDVNPILLCFGAGKLTEQSNKSGIKTIIYDIRTNFLSFNLIKIVLTIKNIKNIIEENKIEVVQVNEWSTALFIKIISFFSKRKIKIIWICHGQWYAFNKVKSTLLNKSIDTIIAVSDCVKNNLMKNKVNESKIRKVPLGIDISLYSVAEKSSIKEELRIKEEVKTFAIIGRFQEIKGQKLVTEAIKRLKEMNIKCKFIFVGDSIFNNEKDNNYKKDIIGEIKSSNLQEYTEFVGVRLDIPNIIKAMDAIIVPSINESFGMVVIESMASGTLVISTPCDGPSEILRNNYTGLLLKERNSEQLVNVIKDLIDEKIDINKIVEKAKDEVENYSIQAVCQRYYEIYKEV